MADNVAEHSFQRGIDDGILKLRMPETVCVPGFGEIVKTDCQAQFARLQLLAPQLADQPRRFTQSKSQRGLIVRLVVRQRRIAGNAGAVFDFQQQRLIPVAVRKKPKLLPPNAKSLFQQHGRQYHSQPVRDSSCEDGMLTAKYSTT
jgi:hypothetical protein